MTYRDVLLPRVVDPSSLCHSKISYARNFPLPSSQSEVCKRLPAGFDPSAPRNSKIAYRDVLLSSKENRKDQPRGVVEFSSVRRSKISYTRDFLLSLSELEACKRLPGGFDPLTQCEVDGSCSSLFDTHKISGSFLSHESGVSRCGSSSSAGRKSGDGSHYSPHSRCFRRFAGKSDKPNGPPSSDKEVSEGGRASNLYAKKAHSSAESLSKERVEDEKTNEGDGSHYGPHSKHIRQFAGHNRLLGSGPNLFQSTASTLAAKPEAQLQYELRKSDNPYHHPNSYKEAPKAGRASDLCAKEAHSSAESLNKERVVDEKTKEGTATSKLSGFPLSVPVVVLKYALLWCIKIVALLALVFRIAKITYRDVLFSFKEIRKDRRRPRGVDLSSSRHSKFSYTRDFLLSLSQLEVCKSLPAGFDPSTPRNSKITYRDVLLSIKEIRKDRPHGADLSWRSKISYTRDFLLSLSELEVCKRLPSGFNPSTSCEVDAAWTSLFDMQKISCSLLSRVSRVSQCGSSSSARCESGNSPRSSGGKQDSQSSESNNQHRGSQGDCGSGNGSHYGPHSQYFRQFAGHNGLLGSGSNLFQCTAGTLAPKPEAQLQYELRKSDNPYRHPYYYKEAPKEGRASDLYAEEAHSSVESLNKERVEDDKTKGGTVISKLSGFPFSVADDTFSYFSDECPCTVTNSRGIKPGNFSGITEVDNIQVNESYDDDWAAIVSMLHVEQESRLSSIPLCDQMSDSAIDDTLIPQKPMLLPEMAPNLRSVELKLHPIPDSNELASEYCLPDEDSLISFDDLIIPQHSVSTSGGSLSRDCMWPLLVTKEVSDTYLAQNVMLSNERSTVPGYYGVSHRGNLYHDQQSQQSYPQFSHSQTNMGLPSFDALYSHQAQMNCQPNVIGPMNSCGTSPLKPHFNAQCRPSGSKAKSKKKDLSSCYSVLQQPRVFPRYQQNELFMGPSFPNYEAQMMSFSPGLNPVQMWPAIYQQPGNEGFRLPNPDGTFPIFLPLLPLLPPLPPLMHMLLYSRPR